VGQGEVGWYIHPKGENSMDLAVKSSSRVISLTLGAKLELVSIA